MSKVKVYGFQKYDIRTDENVRSTRMATMDAILAIHAWAIPGSELEIDEALLRDGMTARNFVIDPAQSGSEEAEPFEQTQHED